MERRPAWITVIAWILIVMGVSFWGASLWFMVRAEPPSLTIVLLGALGMSWVWLIPLVCGFGVLLGKNWARFLYLAWMTIGSIGVPLGTAAEGRMNALLLDDFVSFFVMTSPIALFLFHPRATEYFQGQKSGPPIEGAVKIAVPTEFFTVRVSGGAIIWLHVYVALLASAFLADIKDTLDHVWPHLALAALAALLWVIGLRLWRKADMVGYWWVSALTYLRNYLKTV